MKFLVTGGAGFIGANFIHYWLAKHSTDSIVNLDALTYAGNLENLSDIAHNPSYQFIQGNICNPVDVKKAMKGIDTVVHFAAESHVDRSIQDATPFVTTNVLGTYTLLEAALAAKVTRFHHISTDEVFGSLKLSDSSTFDERTPYDPRSPYSASKASSDHLVRAYYHTYGLPITITNCSNNYGPYQFPEKLIPLAITNSIEDKAVPVYGDGKNIRDWLYVEDHCRAIDAVLMKGIVGETYCVGGMTTDMDNLTIVSKILSLLKKPTTRIEFVKDRLGHDLKYAVNWGKIQKELGWEPQHDFDAWLKETVEWYKNHQDWWRRVKSGEYHS